MAGFFVSRETLTDGLIAHKTLNHEPQIYPSRPDCNELVVEGAADFGEGPKVRK